MMAHDLPQQLAARLAKLPTVLKQRHELLQHPILTQAFPQHLDGE